jgi:putative lipoprotein
MKNLIRILVVVLLGLSVAGCELFDRQFWKEALKDCTYPTPWGYSCTRTERVYY